MCFVGISSRSAHVHGLGRNATRDKDLISFLGASYSLDLYNEFNNMKNVTMFVPKFTAFQRLAGNFENMDRAAFRHVLRYHVVPGLV